MAKLTLNSILKGPEIYYDDPEIIEEESSMWIQKGKDYIPTTDIKVKKKLNSGVYKIKYVNEEMHIYPVELESDEIYTFSEDLTVPILQEMSSFWDKKEVYKENKIMHKRGLLLAGSAGCGKTSLITLLCKQLIAQDGIIFLATNIKEFEMLYYSLKDVIRKIEPTRPIISVIEDVDKIIDNVGDGELLEFLDGKTTIEHHVVIFTSNDTSGLSQAFLRPSRIDMHYIIPNPSESTRREYFIKKGIDNTIIDDCVNKTENMSFAELKEVFIGIKILGKDLDTVINQINNPTECRNYLNKKQNFGL